MTATEDAVVDIDGTGEVSHAGSPSLQAALTVPGMHLVGCETELLRRSRFRPVFRYRVEYADDAGTSAVERIIIGKADYRHGGSRTFDYMRRLWEAGAEVGNELGIPEPIAYLPDLSLLVQTEAPGRCLYEWLVAGPSHDLGPAAAAGRWLGRLHSTPWPEGTGEAAADLTFEERKLAQYGTELSTVLPAEARRLDELSRRALAMLGGLPPGRGVPTHGDYQPKNIYVDGTDVTVIDWDRGALSRPERDVGHFVGQCLTMSYSKTGTFAGGIRWNESFLDGYRRTAPPGWERGLPPYLARTLVEILYYKLVVKPVKDASFVPAWLDHMEAALAS